MGRIHRLRGWGILPPAKAQRPEPQGEERTIAFLNESQELPQAVVDELFVVDDGRERTVSWSEPGALESFEPSAHPIVMGVDPAADAPAETFHPVHGRLAVLMPAKPDPLKKQHPRSSLERLLGSVPDPILASASKPFTPVAPHLTPTRKRRHQSKWRRPNR